MRLLEEIKLGNLELERKDSVRRYFRFDWTEVAKCNPHYHQYVESERERLGENHPLFRTQYALLPIHGNGRFLNQVQLAQVRGGHLRRHRRHGGNVYITGLDLAGEEETSEDQMLSSINPGRNATVLTVAEALVPAKAGFHDVAQPCLQVVEHISWTGERHASLYSRLVDILKNAWSYRRIWVVMPQVLVSPI